MSADVGGAGPTRALLVRHGQSTWNADGRWQGQADPPLSALGENQATEAAARLTGIETVWSSDLVRARATAERIAAALGLTVHVDPRLRERHAGPWQGRTRVEIEQRWPGYLAEGQRPEGYEPDASVLGRALDALDDLHRAHEGAAVLVVTHGGVVRTVERHLADPRDDPLPNLSGRWIRCEAGGAWVLGERLQLLDEGSVTVPGQL